MANRVDPDETAHYEPSHLDLPCLQRCLYWSVGMQEVKHITNWLQTFAVKMKSLLNGDCLSLLN